MDARMKLQEDPVFESVMGIKQQAMPPLMARPAIALTSSIFKASASGYEVLSEGNQFFTRA